MVVHQRNVNGVLLLDKPSGVSSNAALQVAKRLFGATKAGHTGTLDPCATGLLPVCFGQATKFSAALLNADKTYQAVIKLGVTTTTGDAEGQIVSAFSVNLQSTDISIVLRRFVGKIRQIPPMQSALKYRGKPLYAYGRKGIEVKRTPREVSIYSLSLDALQHDRLYLTVTCGKGTYVRVLAEDVGRALGCGGHLKSLRRTSVGEFDLERAYTLAQLETMTSPERDACIQPVDILLKNFPELVLNSAHVKCLMQGQAAWHSDLPFAGKVRLYDGEHRFLGLGEIGEGGKISPKRLLALNWTC